MKREEIVEAMARALCDSWGYSWEHDPEDDQTCAPDGQEVEYCPRPSQAQFKDAVSAALTALEARGLAVVPVVATDKMQFAGRDHLRAMFPGQVFTSNDARLFYAAMVTAAKSPRP